MEDTSGAKALGMLLEAIYEQDCYDFSYGFRPGHNPHQALHEGRQGVLGGRMREGIDGDISAFCETVPHDTLWAMLRKRIQDGRVLARIETWRPAGILDGQEMVYPEKGSPQGAVLSPL